MNLNNVGLRVSPLTGTIMLIRVGKDKRLALDKREAENDLYICLEELQKHHGNYSQSFQNPVTKEWYKYTVEKLKAAPIKKEETSNIVQQTK